MTRKKSIHRLESPNWSKTEPGRSSWSKQPLPLDEGESTDCKHKKTEIFLAYLTGCLQWLRIISYRVEPSFCATSRPALSYSIACGWVNENVLGVLYIALSLDHYALDLRPPWSMTRRSLSFSYLSRFTNTTPLNNNTLNTDICSPLLLISDPCNISDYPRTA